jgi:hypothetical protein
MTADFAFAISQVRSEGRALIESLMVDTCIITRAGTGKGAFNEATGQYATPARQTIYTGKCRFQSAGIANAASTVVDAGDRAADVQGGELQLPVVGSADVAVNDVVELTSAPADPDRVGRKYNVSTRMEKTDATARRLRLLEVTA